MHSSNNCTILPEKCNKSKNPIGTLFLDLTYMTLVSKDTDDHEDHDGHDDHNGHEDHDDHEDQWICLAILKENIFVLSISNAIGQVWGGYLQATTCPPIIL